MHFIIILACESTSSLAQWYRASAAWPQYCVKIGSGKAGGPLQRGLPDKAATPTGGPNITRATFQKKVVILIFM